MASDTDTVDEVEVEETEAEESSSQVRPGDLAKELGVDAKRIRAFLRQEFPRAAEAKNTSWSLSDEQVTAVYNRFDSSDEDDETEGSDDEA